MTNLEPNLMYRLLAMSPAQFEEAVARSPCPASELPGQVATQRQRADELLKYCERRGQLAELESAISQSELDHEARRMGRYCSFPPRAPAGLVVLPDYAGRGPSSTDELVALLMDRATQIDKTVAAISVKKLARLGVRVDKREANSLLEVFNDLHMRHVDALRTGQAVRAHETLREIYRVLQRLQDIVDPVIPGLELRYTYD